MIEKVLFLAAVLLRRRSCRQANYRCVSPMTSCSTTSPPTTTSPVAIPTRAWSSSAWFSCGTRSARGSPGRRHRRLWPASAAGSPDDLSHSLGISQRPHPLPRRCCRWLFGRRGLDERRDGPSYHEPLSRVAGSAEPLFVASRDFVTDSPLEGAGFELPVPRAMQADYPGSLS